MTPANRRPLNERIGLPLVAVIFLVSGCASRNPTPFVSDLDATKIVKQNADDAFITHLTSQELSAMTDFKDKIAPATSRAELVAAWRSIPALEAKGSDFLERRVFSRAIADGDWASKTLGLTPTELEAAFVKGVQEAVVDFINSGGS